MPTDTEQSHSEIQLNELEPLHKSSTPSLDADPGQKAETAPTLNRPSLIRRLLDGWWTLELVSMSLALITFVLYLNLLKEYDGALISSWYDNPLSIFFKTLQSEAAFLITIFRAFMLYPVTAAMGQMKWHYFKRRTPRPVADLKTFDDASKGISGSLRLILSKNAFHSLSVGCVLIIGTLYLGSSTQNTILTQNSAWRDTLVNSGELIAKLPLCNNYTKYSKNDVAGEDQNINVALSMQADILNGWSYFERSQSYRNPEHSEKDINSLPLNCSGISCRWKDIATLAVGHTCESVPVTYDTGKASSSRANITNIMFAPDDSPQEVKLRLKASSDIPGNSSFVDTYNSPGVLVHIAAIASKKELEWEAAECILYWEVQMISESNYSASTLILNERIADRHNNAHIQDSDKGNRHITIDAPCNFRNNMVCPYTVSHNAHSGLRNFLTGLFKGYIYVDEKPKNIVSHADDVLTNLFARSYTGINHSLPDALEAYVNNVAISIGENIRAISPEWKHGEVKANLRYAIDWAYVLYPGIMLILSMYLFFSTIWRSWNSPIWKSSSLPFLYHGFERPVGDQNSLSNLAWMEEVSEKSRVVLQDRKDGLGLKLRKT